MKETEQLVAVGVLLLRQLGWGRSQKAGTDSEGRSNQRATALKTQNSPRLTNIGFGPFGRSMRKSGTQNESKQKRNQTAEKKVDCC